MEIVFYSNPERVCNNIMRGIETSGEVLDKPASKEKALRMDFIFNETINKEKGSFLEQGIISFRIKEISFLALEFVKSCSLISFSQNSFPVPQKELKFLNQDPSSDKMIKINKLYSKLLESNISPDLSRNFLPLATLTDCYISLNTRQAIMMALKFLSSSYSEAIEIGESVFQYLKQIIPQFGSDAFYASQSWAPWANFKHEKADKKADKNKKEDFKIFKKYELSCPYLIEEEKESHSIWQVEASLTTAAVGELNRSNFYSLLISYPNFFLIDAVPYNKEDSSGLVTEILETLGMYPEIFDALYSATLGRVRKVVLVASKEQLTSFLFTNKFLNKELINFQKQIKIEINK